MTAPETGTAPAAVRSVLVIVGAGPRATGILERLGANAPGLPGDRGLDIHLVDPHPPGAGRVWREEQSPLLWMNSMAEDVTMFTDESVQLGGPVRPGPTLHEWAGLSGNAFASRRVQGRYLRWVHERALAALPPGTTVRHHARRAVRVSGRPGERQRVWLEGGAAPLDADLVILTLGHLDAEPDEAQRLLTAHAERHGLVYLPPAYTADLDLSGLEPGADVLVRGFGLAFVDLMVLLTEGRGGRYGTGADGGLVYHPSGREPVLHVGSRRGVPYHAKIGYGLGGERPPLPRFFGPGQAERLLAGATPPDFRRDLWPLVAKELGFAHYYELFTAHPERTRLPWADFERRYAAAEPLGPALDALVAEAVPDPVDRLDLAAVDRPLTGVRHTDPEAFQAGMRELISADLTRRHDPAHSPDLAVFFALLSTYGQLVRFGDTGPWWHGFFSFLASGPPGPRLRQLLALSRAGIVRFLGADLSVTTPDGAFRATSPTVPGAALTTRALVEARLPAPTVATSADPLLRDLYDQGARASADGLLAVDPGDGRILDRTGTPHPRRFALGPHTDARGAGAFTRPGTNSPAFRQNDATARAVLAFLQDLSCRLAA